MSNRQTSSLYREFKASLLFLPIHFLKKGKTLDAAFDDYRLHQELSSSCLDLILMSYRYVHFFEKVFTKFSTKKIKPPELKDLLLLGFSALITRDKTPAFAIVSELVELSKETFGAHTAGLTNAFLRQCLRQKENLIEELNKNPLIIFPDWLKKRWSNDFDLTMLSKHFCQRPSSGTSVFNEQLDFSKISWSEEVFENEKVQAMDFGSYAFCTWLCSKIKDSDQSFLDLCAAPGGKAIFVNQFLLNKGKSPHPILCEKKLPRLKTLKNNWNRWGFPSDSSTFLLHEWGKDQIPSEVKNQSFDFALCDLPCSGSGTLITRPDVLLQDWELNLSRLMPIQSSIIKDLKSLKIKKTFVSICSVDQKEIDSISDHLGQKPDFYSWQKTQDFSSEGIVGWYCESC